MMLRMQILILSVMLMVGVMGCEKSSGGSGGQGEVGVVNVPELMKIMGDDVTIENELKRVGDQRSRDLNQIRATLLEQYEAKQKEFGENPTDAQKKELALMQQKAATTFRENQMKANNAYTNLRNEMLSARQKEYGLMVEQLAEEKGLKMVLYKGTVGNVVYHHESIDLTNEVAEKLKASRGPGGAAVPPTSGAGSTPPSDSGTGTTPSGDGGEGDGN